MQATQQREIDLARCRRDLAYYASTCLWIVTKQARLERFDFNRAQQIVAAKVAKQLAETGSVMAIVLKARQEGISTWVAGRFFRRANLYPNQNILIIADLKKRSGKLFKIYDTFHRHLPDAVRPQKRYAGKNELVYDSPSGTGGLNSTITVDTAKDVDVGRAETIHCLHGSEVASWENAEDLWIGLSQAIPTTGAEIFLESTAKGVGNFFHQMWLDAESGANGFIAIFLPWWIHEEYCLEVDEEDIATLESTLTAWEREAIEVGIEWEGEFHRLSYGQIAWRRQTIRDKFIGDERSFRQEYPSTAREAFLVSGNMFFDEDVLTNYEEMTRPAIWRGNLALHGNTILPVRAERGHLRVFSWPKPNGHYVLFGDTATGKEISARETSLSEAEAERGGRDFSCCPVMEVTTGEFVAELHGRMAPEVFAEQIQLLGYFYSTSAADSHNIRVPSLVGVERNHSSGETTLKVMRHQLHYPRLFYARQEQRRNDRRPSDVPGWMTTVINRQRMLDDLAQAMRERAIDIPSADAIRECFTFVRGETGKPEAQEGCHDDRVMAYAGCLQMASFSRRPSRSSISENDLEYTASPAGFWSG